mmetsp:Transcript_15385/g.26257  ORF Transcript_15385/g.26257 Transcript_15385/m.26257 type:complete len:249 (-) Transcript_15385:275-1021(-)|eukprot:CAMPEP_0183730136 /NCGR_PEP_ID=MMETSP0737-20130205/32065_1 /TAXON_ID=385413 /ORGANISM="Thalassiosira miniscula, Strain CCMP1093" /LENGTH=248 /DNA_ID=CAMNT_0025962539 /DNA_START=51 /DNA_END=797 /DNA_ORIENTATION=+
MASLFKQISDDMEKVAQVVEEGAKFMMGSTDQMGEEGNINDAAGGGDAFEYDDGDEDMDHGMFDNIEGMEDVYGSPLMGMAENVMSDIMSHQIGPQTPKEHIQAFAAAITWNETFIKSLLAFHAAVLVTALLLSRKGGVYGRMALMIFLGIIVRAAEYLNATGARRWREFATQNYFDKGGIFMGIMVCAPLLVVCSGMLFSMIYEASNLLVDVKKMKIDAQKKAKEKKNEKKEMKQQKKDEKRRKKKD